MRRVGSWGMTAVLIVGLGGAVGTGEASEYDGKPPAPKGLLTGLFAGKPKAQAKSAIKPVEDKAEPPATVDSAAIQQQRHMNAYLRRMAVCDRLHRIALDTGNEALTSQADQLLNRAQEIYNQQTASLPGSLLPRASKPTVQRPEAREVGGLTDKEVEEGSSLPTRMPRSLNAGGLNGSMDRREQAILNGSSMEGEKP